MLCVCVGDVMDVVFSVCIVRRGAVGECECFVMQMLYVCVLCASCGSSQCCVLHDLQFVNSGRGCNRRPYRRGSKRHGLQAVELSQRTQAAVQIVSNLPPPSNGDPIYRFWGHAGHEDPPNGWRCCSQKRVMSRPIQARQL